MNEDVMIVGGLFDNLLKSLIQWPDFKKADHTMLKSGIGLSLDSLKPATNSLGGMLLDAAKQALHAIVDNLKASAPLVVGASPDAVMEHAISGGRKRSREDVEKMIVDEGGDPKQFAPWLLMVLQFMPMAIELIRKLLGK